MSIVIRPARAAEQATIGSIVHEGQINPNGLDWRRFLVADDQGVIVGIGQVKPHSDGSRELASIAVIPKRQGQGIARTIIESLLARESEPLVLMCRAQHESLYERFGFRRMRAPEMPRSMRRLSRAIALASPTYRLIKGESISVVFMKQPTSDESPMESA